MPDKSVFTFREAVLTSLLVHAGIFIFFLMFPGILHLGARIAVADPNTPIPVTFFKEEDSEPDKAPMIRADAGRRNASAPRPDSAPPARNDDPFSIGNNPNRFVAPPVASPPSPEPGPAASSRDQEKGITSPPEGGEGPGDEESESASPGNRAREERRPSSEDPFARPGSIGEGDGEKAGRRQARRGESLRAALGRLATGLSSGGAPLRFDNPVGGLSGPSGGLSFDTKGFDWGPYARKIYWIIWANWRQGWPPAARAGLSGWLSVRMRIWRDGRISDIQVIEPSGTPAFDTCATVALEASNPLPPLPSDFPSESEGVTARFFYNMRPP
ncbi:MAG: energy transducer TonB [Acidobacteriota bacterium]